MAKKTILLAALILTLTPLVASAATRLEFIAPLPGQSLYIPTNPAEYFRNIYIIGFYLAIALAVLMIIWGGVEYAVSGAIDRKADARARIWAAILGIVLLLASVLILNTINPNLTQFQSPLLNIKDACTAAGGTKCK